MTLAESQLRSPFPEAMSEAHSWVRPLGCALVGALGGALVAHHSLRPWSAIVEEQGEEQGEAVQRDKKDEEKKGEAWGSDDWDFNWTKQCSKHLLHIEGRLMESEYLAHEVVRQVQIIFHKWVPPPRGHWGSLLRPCTDISVRTVRQLCRYVI